jgi:hypothetical protein
VRALRSWPVILPKLAAIPMTRNATHNSRAFALPAEKNEVADEARRDGTR